MKKTFIGVLIFIFLILAAAIVLPAIYKEDISRAVQKEINKNINARVGFKDVKLSLLRSFPHFSLGLKEFSVVGKDMFEYDTLLYVPDFRTTVDLLSVIKKGPVQVIGIQVDNPRIKIVVLEDGTPNYDIMYPEEEITEEETSSEGSGEVLLQMQKVVINNATFIYDDESLPVYAEVHQLNHKLKGDLTQTSTLLNTYTESPDVSVTYDGIKYLSNVRAEINANLNVDFEQMRFDFADNLIYINEIPLEAEGFFAMPGEAYDMDISFASRNKSFKPLLSMVPAIYKNDFEMLEADGEIDFSGRINGIYDEENVPRYHIKLNVKEGMFKYPEMPVQMEDIEVSATVDNSTGETDDLVLEVSDFGFLMSGSTFRANLRLENPVSDPYIKTRMSGELDLAKITELYPVEHDMTINGLISLDANLEGNASSIENEQYDNFKALGYILLEDLSYADDEYDLKISRGQFNLSPEYVDMAAFNMELGDSDLQAEGKLTGFLAYLLEDGTLQGNLNLRSQNLDMNQLLSDESSGMETQDEEFELSAPVIPERVNFKMTSRLDHVVYENMVMDDVEGTITLQDQTLRLDKVFMSSLGGTTSLSGFYSNDGKQKPRMEMEFGLEEVSVNKTAVAFTAMSKYAPIARKANGAISTSFQIKTDLQDDLMPVYETMFGNGSFRGKSLSLGDVNALNKLAETLKVNELKNAALENIKASFTIRQGSFFVEPFDMKYNGMKATLGGRTGLDQTIDYNLRLEMPRQKLGSQANKMLDNLSDKVGELGVDYTFGDVIPFNIKITGMISDPSVKPDIEVGEKDFKEQVKQEIDEKIEESKEKVREEIQKQIDKAEQKAQKLLEEAQNKVQKIRNEGQKAAEKLRQETDKKADQLLSEAEGKGFVAKLAAEKAAEKAREKGYEKAEKLELEANQQADNLIEEAKKKGEKLIEEAKQSAETEMP